MAGEEVLANSFAEMFPGLAITGMFMFLYFVVLAWSMIWKGIALWKAGNNNQIIWFIILFLVNTMGILEIIYLLGFQKKEKKVIIKTELKEIRKEPRNIVKKSKKKPKSKRK